MRGRGAVKVVIWLRLSFWLGFVFYYISALSSQLSALLLQVLYAAFDFFLLAGVEGAGVGAAEIPADAAGYGDAF